MIHLRLTSSPAAFLLLKPCYLPSLNPIQTRYDQLKKLKQGKLRDGKCRAEFSADTPVAVAIGACILNSLIFPVSPSPVDIGAESLIDSDDTRFAVMGIISLIPYFNWMSWVFAWLDTGKRRYAVYAIAYLAPYLRPNLSISPDDSWLPILCILLCITHIQLEASIKNGDIQAFRVFKEAANDFSWKKKHRRISGEEERKDFQNFPSAREHYRNSTRDCAARKKLEDHDILNDDEDANGGANE